MGVTGVMGGIDWGGIDRDGIDREWVPYSLGKSNGYLRKLLISQIVAYNLLPSPPSSTSP